MKSTSVTWKVIYFIQENQFLSFIFASFSVYLRCFKIPLHDHVLFQVRRTHKAYINFMISSLGNVKLFFNSLLVKVFINKTKYLAKQRKIKKCRKGRFLRGFGHNALPGIYLLCHNLDPHDLQFC